jgi:hypothetical protein
MESGDELATILVCATYAVGPVRLFGSHDFIVNQKGRFIKRE